MMITGLFSWLFKPKTIHIDKEEFVSLIYRFSNSPTHVVIKQNLDEFNKTGVIKPHRSDIVFVFDSPEKAKMFSNIITNKTKYEDVIDTGEE